MEDLAGDQRRERAQWIYNHCEDFKYLKKTGYRNISWTEKEQLENREKTLQEIMATSRFIQPNRRKDDDMESDVSDSINETDSDDEDNDKKMENDKNIDNEDNDTKMENDREQDEENDDNDNDNDDDDDDDDDDGVSLSESEGGQPTGLNVYNHITLTLITPHHTIIHRITITFSITSSNWFFICSIIFSFDILSPSYN